MKKTISAKNIYTAGKILNNQMLTIQDGVISAIHETSKDTSFDFENIAPALFDIHINGGEEFHFTQNPSEECLFDMLSAAESNGTGYILPTLITSSVENIKVGINAVKTFIKSNPNSGIIGMHLEGPFLNPKKRGAHLEKYIQKPSDLLIKELLEFGEDTLKLMTIAPEMFTKGQINLLLNSKIKISAGHSNATYSEAQEAFSQGINLVTHLYNAMSAFTHRAPGLIGASLLNTEVYAPIILDGVHCDWSAAELALRNKKEKLFLISDALFQNHKKKIFKWEEFDAKLIDNQYLNSENNLAGATISLFDAVRNAVEMLKIPLERALEMATGIPASLIATERKIGKVTVGFEARFISFPNDLKMASIIKF